MLNPSVLAFSDTDRFVSCASSEVCFNFDAHFDFGVGIGSECCNDLIGDPPSLSCSTPLESSTPMGTLLSTLKVPIVESVSHRQQRLFLGCGNR